MLWMYAIARRLLMLACFAVIKGMRPVMADTLLGFTNEPNSSVYVQSNRSFLVPCEAVGKPSPRKYWRIESVLNSRVVINTTTKGLWFVNGVQSLGSSGVHRVGIFRCIARNTAGVVMSKKFELSLIRLQNISVQLSSAALFQNVVRLKCAVDTNQPVKYTWFKDNTPLNGPTDSRLEFLSSGVLQIRDYNVSDDGTYSCRAENEYKVVTSRGLEVVGKSASKTSIHIYPGKIIHTKVGSPLVIECIQYSPQKSSVSWSKVTGLATRSLVNGAGFVNLVFDSVQESDAGEYRCLATDGVEETVRLSVGVEPSFTTRLSATTKQKEGEILVLKCNVSGNPTPTVTWYKDGKALVQDSRIRFYENILELQNVAMSDKGVYQCEIENMYGSSIDDTLLQVVERKGILYKAEGYATSPTRINVYWIIPPNTGEKRVYFVVNCLDYARKSDFQLITDYNVTHLLLTALRPHTKYAICVKMYDDYGALGQSNAFWIRTLETAPSGTPNEVDLTSYSYGTLDVTWLPPLISERNGEIISYEIKYSVEGESKEVNVTIEKPFYTTTLSNLIEGNNYTVKIAARTTAGQGPFSKDVSRIVSRTPGGTVSPPPLVLVKNVNASIMVSVTPPANVDVKGYEFTSRLLGDVLGDEMRVVINEKAFFYPLKKQETNSEHVIRVTAFGPGTSRGRPAIVVVYTKDFPAMVNYTMFSSFSNSNKPPITISCHLALNSTALVVKWKNIPVGNDPEFEVSYFAIEKSREVTKVVTKYSNLTLYKVLPGKTYFVQVKTMFRQHPVLGDNSTEGIPQSQICKVPAKELTTHTSRITCSVSGSAIVVKWRTTPYDKIRQYIMSWHGKKNEAVREEIYKGKGNLMSYTLTNFKIHQNFTVIVTAKPFGKRPFGHCVIDSRKIPLPTNPSNESGDNTDIEKGIIIGCIISVLLLFLLVMFVCWSGCRRRKPNRDVQNNDTPYSRGHTVSSEVSEISAKNNRFLKKFTDEETSKESDRGVGMTPKSSRLDLDSEKMPFLPKAVNQGGSVDTSCDSEDSGLGKKLSPTPGALKDPDKRPLQPEGSVMETVF